MFAIELNNTDGKYSRRDTLTSILSTNYAKASNDVVTTATRFAMQIKRAAISCACRANSAVLETWTKLYWSNDSRKLFGVWAERSTEISVLERRSQQQDC